MWRGGVMCGGGVETNGWICEGGEGRDEDVKKTLSVILRGGGGVVGRGTRWCDAGNK